MASRDIGDIVSNASVATLAKQPLGESKATQAASQASNTRRLLAKKSTAVFKDTLQAPSVEPDHLDLPKSVSAVAPIPPVHRELQSHRPQQLQTDASEPKLRRTKSKAVLDAAPKKYLAEPLIVSIPSEEPSAVRSDGVYIDDRGEVQVYQFSDEPSSVQDAIHILDSAVALPSDVHHKDHDGPSVKQTDATRDPIQAETLQQPSRSSKQQLVPLSEPEEYWDEDEYDENYPEEGYVTARSYKSRGENNTTGGATTVLFPKASQKSRKEIAAASALMDAAKASGQLDDETWDTTMVAEYGDEIFQYMRELEVGFICG